MLQDLKNQNYDSTLTVLQQDEETLINKDYEIEVYTKKSGMIYKKVQHIQMQALGNITQGVDMTYTINSYGK